MRNIGKLVSLALVVAVAPLLSACNKAEQAQPKSYVSLNEAWSWLQRTLWPPTRADPRVQRLQIGTTKVDGTDNVYIFRNGNHQSMFIITKDGVIATDPIAYARPTGGQDYIAEIKKVTDKPIKFLIYSHHHYDHIAGGKPFKDAGATIVAHRRAKERLAVLKDPNTPLPDQVVSDAGRTIKLGGTTLELKYFGLIPSP